MSKLMIVVALAAVLLRLLTAELWFMSFIVALLLTAALTSKHI